MPMQQDSQSLKCKIQLEGKTCHQAMSEVDNLDLILELILAGQPYALPVKIRKQQLLHLNHTQ